MTRPARCPRGSSPPSARTPSGTIAAALAAAALTSVVLAACSSTATTSPTSTTATATANAGTGAASTRAASSAARTTTASSPATSAAPTATPTTSAPATATPAPPAPSTAGSAKGSVTVLRALATGVDVPWGLAELPDGTVLVTSRDDFRISRLDVTGASLTTVGTVPGVVSNVAQQGEAGLLGLAVSPRFATDRLLYVYYSTASDNRIATIAYDPSRPSGERLGAPTVILGGIPHGVHHNGGRLAFGPDGYLYATTGEAGTPALAQEKSSLGGKILRLTTAGKAAPGNPFGTRVWSYGHRNVQGLAWDAKGRLWASEFGDHSADELNLIVAGRNYGWPATEGETSRSGFTGPVAQWGPDEDSPSGIAIAAGSVWMAALKGERLWRIPLDGAKVVADPTAFLTGRYGRLRSVLALDAHTLLVTTSNRDGRQSPGSGDDRVLEVRVG